jgi:heat shock protein beta
MRLLRPFVLSLTVLSSYVRAQDLDYTDVPKEKHDYQVRQHRNMGESL